VSDYYRYKALAKKENKVLFINAEREFARFGSKNKLRSEDIEKVLAKYTDRKDEEFFARHVDQAEIAENDYSLSVTTYVTSEDKREKVNIQQLNRSITEIVSRQSVLRNEIDVIVANLEKDLT
jgi:type I restriction enzyme M protein